MAAEQKKGFSEDDRKALGTMLVQINKNGDGLTAYTEDGKPLPEEDMNAAQKEALKNFQAVMFPPKPTAAAIEEKK